MKKDYKFVAFFLIVLLIVGLKIASDYKIKSNNIKKNNEEFQYLDKEISGLDLSTIINKVIDKNTNNQVNKAEDGLYEDNNENSIIIDIKFLQADNDIRFEKIYDAGMNKFINLYSEQRFKCVEIKHHKNEFISYLKFEELE